MPDDSKLAIEKFNNYVEEAINYCGGRNEDGYYRIGSQVEHISNVEFIPSDEAPTVRLTIWSELDDNCEEVISMHIATAYETIGRYLGIAKFEKDFDDVMRHMIEKS